MWGLRGLCSAASAAGGLDGTCKFFDFHGMSEAKAGPFMEGTLRSNSPASKPGCLVGG